MSSQRILVDTQNPNRNWGPKPKVSWGEVIRKPTHWSIFRRRIDLNLDLSEISSKSPGLKDLVRENANTICILAGAMAELSGLGERLPVRLDNSV